MGTIRVDGVEFDPIAVRLAGREFRHENGGVLPTDGDLFGQVWDALRARRAINPVRFDRWHPTVGPWLALDETIRHQPTVGPAPIVPTTPPVGAVPEPWSGLMLAIGVAAVYMRSRMT